jgi:hypothetical protein
MQHLRRKGGLASAGISNRHHSLFHGTICFFNGSLGVSLATTLASCTVRIAHVAGLLRPFFRAQ